MNRTIKSIIVLAVLVAGYFFFFQKKEVLPPKNDIVVAFGDSLVAGVGATEGHDFISLVSQKVGVPIINAGLSGDTTTTALNRVESVLAANPGTVIVLLGGNDYLRKIPKETTFQNLHTIVSTFKDNNIRVLLLGVRGGLLRDTYAEDFENFAQAEEISFIPNVLDGVIGNNDFLSPDHIHPNDRGYEKMAEKVAPKLRDVLGR